MVATLTTKTRIGLGSVDNTSDANKPVSTAQAAEISEKANSLPSNQRKRARRIGHMNVGKAVITIRHDDGHTADATVLDPLLFARNLVATFAVPASYPNETGNLTTAQIATLLDHGHEIACHSYTHGYDTTPFNTHAKLIHETVDARAALEALITNLRAELWVTPGTSGLFAADTDWDGDAGELVSGTFVAATGYTYSHYWPANQEIYGVSELQADSGLTLTQLKAAIDQAIANNSILHLSLHAANLDVAGKITTADWTSVLDYIALQVANGLAENLTLTGGMFAQPYGDWENLILEGDFGCLPYPNSTWGPWVAVGTPVLKTDGGSYGSNYVQCNLTNYVAQSRYNVDLSDAEGGHYRFRCKIRNSTASASSSVIKIVDLTTPANWTVEVDPVATTEWTIVERCVTIPVGLDRVSVVIRSSGTGYIDYDEVELHRI